MKRLLYVWKRDEPHMQCIAAVNNVTVYEEPVNEIVVYETGVNDTDVNKQNQWQLKG